MSKKVLYIILVLSITLVLFGCQKPPAVPEESTPISQENIDNANLFVDLLEGRDFEAAVELFDDEMLKVMPADKLETTWDDLNKQAGAFKEKLEVKTELQSEYEIAHVVSQFEKSKLNIKVIFNSEGEISGLWFHAI